MAFRKDPKDFGDALQAASVLAKTKTPHRKIALEIGKSRSRTSNLLRLRKLPEDVRTFIERGQLTPKHGEVLLKLPPAEASELALEAINALWSTRRLRAAVQARKRGAPAPPEDPNVRHLCDRLGELLGARVRLTTRTDRSGVLSIEFADLECLDGVLERLGYQG